MYAHGFRFYFTPLTGVLFAFPSRYWFTIGRLVVFSLGGWSPHVQTGYHVSRPTQAHLLCPYVYETITLYRVPFHTLLLEHNKLLGSFPFARRYSGNIGWFLFLWVLRCFTSPGSLLYLKVQMTLCVGFPHSDITGYNAPYQLTCAFRRLARPSSPPDAMASTMCAYSLDHTTPDCSWNCMFSFAGKHLSNLRLLKRFLLLSD